MQSRLKNDRKKILIIGASVLQLPAIIKAKKKGFDVGVADYNPKAIGAKYADKYFNVSTINIEGVVNVAKNYKPDGIMTLATDMPMRAVAKACEVCGLPGISFETAVKATDKGEMIKAFETHGVQHPWYHIVFTEHELKAVIDGLTYPCIIKPTDNAGSRGVILCHDRKELERAYVFSRNESRNGAVIIEEYLQGPEFSIEVMVVDGVPHILQITDKVTTGAPHFVEMGHSQPTKQPEEVQERIRDLACRAVKAVGIDIGPAHVEMILTKEGPKMVELGARMGGDCITTHLVPLSTGIDMVGATIDLAIGRQPNLVPKWKKGASIRYFQTSAGILKSVEGLEEAKSIPGIEEITIVKDIGSNISDISSSIDRIGFVISQSDTAEEAVAICEKALNSITISIEPMNA